MWAKQGMKESPFVGEKGLTHSSWVNATQIRGNARRKKYKGGKVGHLRGSEERDD